MTSSSPEWVGAIGFVVGVAVGLIWNRTTGPGSTTATRLQKIQRLALPQKSPAPFPSASFGQSIRVYNPTELSSCYNLIISTATPRPIALVSSRSNTNPEVDNLAPFSYFGVLAHDPPTIGIGFCRQRDGRQKDTLVNILARREFAVHIISEWYLDRANYTCGNFSPNVNEFLVSGLTPVNDLQVVQASRVKEAAISYECQVNHVHELHNVTTGNPTTEIVLATVVRIHVDETVLDTSSDLINKPAVNTAQLQPVGRLGGNIYATLGQLIEIPRPKV